VLELLAAILMLIAAPIGIFFGALLWLLRALGIVSGI
jgi:hypothetical protein